jgi:hypothetical protein
MMRARRSQLRTWGRLSRPHVTIHGMIKPTFNGKQLFTINEVWLRQ